MSIHKISSLQNSFLKDAILLRDNSKRRKKSLFGVEGAREISQALNHGFKLVKVFYCSEFFDETSEKIFLNLRKRQDIEIFDLSISCFQKLVVRKKTDGLFLVFEEKKFELSSLKIKKRALICVIDSVEKPGNLGAILRTCDASAVDAVIVTDPRVDFFNANTIRSSLGAVFTIPLFVMQKEDVNNFCKRHQVKIVSSLISDRSQPYYALDFKSSTAFILGSEAQGISEYWKENADEHAIIPMNGKLDSLNVSVSAAVFLFEALRQRT